MKTTSIFLCLVVLTGFLFSCGSTKTEQLNSESPDKSNVIKVSGTRSIGLDPFQASIIIKGFEQSDTLVTEIYARDLTKENVTFNWADNTSCVLTFIQQDDSKRVLDIRFSEDGNSLREISQ